MMQTDKDWDRIVLRRAQFLLNEANSENPTRDQTVTYAMRVISNWATIGKDAPSHIIKWTNPRISVAAWELYTSCSDREWEKSVINEHPEPIAQVWDFILKERDTLNANAILDRFKLWPMITVTKEEDSELTRNGYRSSGSPAERHSRIKLSSNGAPKRRVEI
jgi:hypothetical protein